METDNCQHNEKRKLRVVFGGMDGRFSTVPLQALAQNHEIVGIVHSEGRPSKDGLVLKWARSGKGSGNLKMFADYYKCAYFEAGRMCSPEFVQFLKYLRADILCLANFSIILPPDIYELPKYGTINLHLSQLPQFKGPNPWLWMFYNQCDKGGCTVHQVDYGEDTGPIINSFTYDVPKNITASDLADEVLPKAGALLAEAVDEISQGTATFTPQTEEEGLIRARYVPPGEALIQWDTWECEKVASFLRGASLWYEPFPPIPGFVRVYGEAVLGDSKGKPGTNHFRFKKGWISCKDGIVPYTVQASPYELMRMLLPIMICICLYSLL